MEKEIAAAALQHIAASLPFVCTGSPTSFASAVQRCDVLDWLGKWLISSDAATADGDASSDRASSVLYLFAISNSEALLSTDMNARPTNELLAAYVRLTTSVEKSIANIPALLAPLPLGRPFPKTATDGSNDINAGGNLLVSLHSLLGDGIAPVLTAALTQSQLSSHKTAGARNRDVAAKGIRGDIAHAADALRSLALTVDVPRLTLTLPTQEALPPSLASANFKTAKPDDIDATALAKDPEAVKFAKSLMDDWSAKVIPLLKALEKELPRHSKQPDADFVYSLPELESIHHTMHWWDGMHAALLHGKDILVENPASLNTQKLIQASEFRGQQTVFQNSVVGAIKDAERVAAAQCCVSSRLVRCIEPITRLLLDADSAKDNAFIPLHVVAEVATELSKVAKIAASESQRTMPHTGPANLPFHVGFAAQCLRAALDACFEALLRTEECVSVLFMDADRLNKLQDQLTVVEQAKADVYSALSALDAFARTHGAIVDFRDNRRLKTLIDHVRDMINVMTQRTYVNNLSLAVCGKDSALSEHFIGGLHALFSVHAAAVAASQQQLEAGFQQLCSVAQSQSQSHVLHVEKNAGWLSEKAKFIALCTKVENTIIQGLSSVMQTLCASIADKVAPKGGVLSRRHQTAAERHLCVLWNCLQRWNKSNALAAALRPRQAEHLSLLEGQLAVIEQRVTAYYSTLSAAAKAAASIALPAMTGHMQWVHHVNRAIASIQSQTSLIRAFFSAAKADASDELLARCDTLLAVCHRRQSSENLDAKQVFAKWANSVAPQLLSSSDASKMPITSGELSMGRKLFAIVRIRDLQDVYRSVAPHLLFRSSSGVVAPSAVPYAVVAGAGDKKWVVLPDFAFRLLEIMREMQASSSYHVKARPTVASIPDAAEMPINWSGFMSDSAGVVYELRKKFTYISTKVEQIYPHFAALGSMLSSLIHICALDEQLAKLSSEVRRVGGPAWEELLRQLTADWRNDVLGLLRASYSSDMKGFSWLSDSAMLRDAFRKCERSAAQLQKVLPLLVSLTQSVIDRRYSEKMLRSVIEAGLSPKLVAHIHHALTLAGATEDESTVQPAEPVTIVASLQQTSIGVVVHLSPTLHLARLKLLQQHQKVRANSCIVNPSQTNGSIKLHLDVDSVITDGSNAFRAWHTYVTVAEMPDVALLSSLGLGEQFTEDQITQAWYQRVHQVLQQLSAVVDAIDSTAAMQKFSSGPVTLGVDCRQLASALKDALGGKVSVLAKDLGNRLASCIPNMMSNIKALGQVFDTPVSNLFNHGDEAGAVKFLVQLGQLKRTIGLDTKLQPAELTTLMEMEMSAIDANTNSTLPSSLQHHFQHFTTVGKAACVKATCNTLRSLRRPQVQLERAVDALWQELQRFNVLAEQRAQAILSKLSEFAAACRGALTHTDSAISGLESRWQSMSSASLENESLSTVLSQLVSIVADLNSTRSFTEGLATAVQTLQQVAHRSGASNGSAVEAVAASLENGRFLQRVTDMHAQATELCSSLQLLRKPSDDLDAILAAPFENFEVKTVRSSLESVRGQLSDVPSSVVSSGQLFQRIAERVAALRDVLPLLAEMRSPAVHPRHVDMLLRALGLSSAQAGGTQQQGWMRSGVRIVDLLDANIRSKESAIRDILRFAAGEGALERYMTDVEQYWESATFETFSSREGIPAIRGWDVILNALDDHTSALASMKMSPYFAAFESLVTNWESKLLGLRSLCTTWIDVQRRWLYLEGLMAMSSATGVEIRNQLPLEGSRFDNVQREMSSIMARVTEMPQVMAAYVWQAVVSGRSAYSAQELRNAAAGQLHHRLQTVAESLDKIQKGLGEYLDHTRHGFPRLYFIGDEDLLELLGASANLPRNKDGAGVSRHVRKMFHGLANISFADVDGNAVAQYVESPEGEVLRFRSSFAVQSGSSLTTWLTQLQDEMINTLQAQTSENISALELLVSDRGMAESLPAELVKLLESGNVTFQSVSLAFWWLWTHAIEQLLRSSTVGNINPALEALGASCLRVIAALANSVSAGKRSKSSAPAAENMLIDVLHKRDVIAALITSHITSAQSYEWFSRMRVYKHADSNGPLLIKQANAEFAFGGEYSGVAERLIITPLTERCFLTLTQALQQRLGGSPFGPAGTGKTETVKALGTLLGRLVLVFNCDDSFDFSSMGRILSGLVTTGSWGCFDEFNRLDENVLSAISQIILEIQTALLRGAEATIIGERSVPMNANVGVFITMNPGYAGRAQLPDNLKALFRPFAMVQPDVALIARVTLITQQFTDADALSRLTTSVFAACSDQLSKQQHYDWGLRAMKAVLQTAGHELRSRKCTQTEALALAVSQCIEPKLTPPDVPLFRGIFEAHFPETSLGVLTSSYLAAALHHICHQRSLEVGFEAADAPQPVRNHRVSAQDGLYHVGQLVDTPPRWNPNAFGQKMLQLYSTVCVRHGIMLVGPTASGKTTALEALLDAITAVDGIDNVRYRIDPKASVCDVSNHAYKDHLYGKLDPQTLEWTDGVFTRILRDICASEHGEHEKRHWIVFDGDIDPEWAENLNSTLDDNKLLTLPTGERITLPANVKIVFETHSVAHATLATVSRCGMVFFDDATVSVDMVVSQFCNELQRGRVLSRLSMHTSTSHNFASGDSVGAVGGAVVSEDSDQLLAGAASLTAPSTIRTALSAFTSFVTHQFNAPHQQQGKWHPIMSLPASSMLFCALRCFTAMFNEWKADASYMRTAQRGVRDRLVLLLGYAVYWSWSSPLPDAERREFAVAFKPLLAEHTPCPATSASDLLLYDTMYDSINGAAVPWSSLVRRVELEPKSILDASLVVQTVDTARHTQLTRHWIDADTSVILCGPPGSGKSLILSSIVPQNHVGKTSLVTIPFSSSTTPSVILSTLEQHCDYVDGTAGLTLQPKSAGSKLIVFCDEINLPAPDKYDCQRVNMFLRQLMERKGFWLPMSHRFSSSSGAATWVHLRSIQFVGACNPPSDPGRTELAWRVLRHTPVIYIDYPHNDVLKAIYVTFASALCKLHPSWRSLAQPIVDASIAVYSNNKQKFKIQDAPQYVYSPRELSRWLRAMYDALAPLVSSASVVPRPGEVVRLWFHEGLRLFHDRCMRQEDRTWCTTQMVSSARAAFAGVVSPSELDQALAQPVVFSDWLGKHYTSADLHALRAFAEAKIKLFNEEVQNTQLVLFDDALMHLLRICRVLRQPFGHLLLVGSSGCGKSVLTKFAAWLTGMTLRPIRITQKYGLAEFDHDLRSVLRVAGVECQRVVFLVDEENVISSAFLERMNTLLASGDVPGLFTNEDLQALITDCRSQWKSMPGGIPANVNIDNEDDVMKHFIRMVQRNLHVVFTMNPQSGAFMQRRTTSPALFNRCVVNWLGDWSRESLAQVSSVGTQSLDLGAFSKEVYKAPTSLMQSKTESARRIVGLLHQAQRCRTGDNEASLAFPDAIATLLVMVHETVQEWYESDTVRGQSCSVATCPRDFVELLSQFQTLYTQQRKHIEGKQLRLSAGLGQIKATEEAVARLRVSLIEKQRVLAEKNSAAEAKLSLMLKEQAQAESKRTAALSLSALLEKQNEEIAARQGAVEGELADAEPALQRAKEGVQSISRRDMDEVRSLAQPPAPVKLILEAVLVLLENETSAADWAEVRRQAKDIIPKIATFRTEAIQPKTRQAIVDRYIQGQPREFTYERINMASRACGPLYTWLVSQVNYSSILDKVEPLRAELDSLTATRATLQAQLADAEANVRSLEASISQYKAEYAELIREAEAMRSQMEAVQAKVDRAVALVSNLAAERTRWETSSQEFMSQVASLAGDCALAAAFLTYAGSFDFIGRQELENLWRICCEQLDIQVDKKDVLDFLVTPNERLQWAAAGIPQDYMMLGNCALLTRCTRFPFVIDSSGAALEILPKLSAEGASARNKQQLARASLLDSAFVKPLESACRFGTQLLLTDAERLTPLLYPVLNKEVSTSSAHGRNTVMVGDHEVDLSPTFKLFLLSADAALQLSPDVSSRVAVVHFSVSQPSLSATLLRQILTAVSPEVARKRHDAIQRESNARHTLVALEDQLLDQISAAGTSKEVSLLENDTLLQSLEMLKVQARQVESELAAASESIASLDRISSVYAPIANSVAAVFTMAQQLPSLSPLYQHELVTFLNAVNRELAFVQPDESSVPQPTKVAELGLQVQLAAARVFATCMYRPHLLAWSLWVYAKNAEMLLDIIRAANGLSISQPAAIPEVNALYAGLSSTVTELPFLADGKTAFASMGADKLGDVVFESVATGWELSPASMNDILTRNGLPNQNTLSSSVAGVVDTLKTHIVTIRRLLSASAYAKDLFAHGAAWLTQRTRILPEDVHAWVEDVASDAFPALLVFATAGADINKLVVGAQQAHGGISLSSVSLGAAQSEAQAEREMKDAALNGTWLVLRNVHLSPHWLHTTLQRVFNGSTKTHPWCRLIFTVEVPASHDSTGLGEKLFSGAPSLRSVQKVLVEAPPGIQHQVSRLAKQLAESSTETIPSNPLYFRCVQVALYLHALLIERRRYIPQGWFKSYDFADYDFFMAAKQIAEYIRVNEKHATAQQMIDGIAGLVRDAVYGARVEQPMDAQRLAVIVQHVLNERSFAPEYELTWSGEEGKGIRMPSVPASSTESLLSWCNGLPEDVPATWLGLTPEVMTQLEVKTGQIISESIRLLVHTSSRGEAAGGVASAVGANAESVLSEASQVHKAVQTVVKTLPSTATSSPIRDWLASQVHALDDVIVKAASGGDILVPSKLAATARAVQSYLWALGAKVSDLPTYKPNLPPALSSVDRNRVLILDVAGALSPRHLLKTLLSHQPGGKSLLLSLAGADGSVDAATSVVLVGTRFSCDAIGGVQLPQNPIFYISGSTSSASRTAAAPGSSSDVIEPVEMPVLDAGSNTEQVVVVSVHLPQAISREVALLAGLALVVQQ